jgi:hypothetical protein
VRQVEEEVHSGCHQIIKIIVGKEGILIGSSDTILRTDIKNHHVCQDTVSAELFCTIRKINDGPTCERCNHY